LSFSFLFYYTPTPTTHTTPLSLHDALPILHQLISEHISTRHAFGMKAHDSNTGTGKRFVFFIVRLLPRFTIMRPIIKLDGQQGSLCIDVHDDIVDALATNAVKPKATLRGFVTVCFNDARQLNLNKDMIFRQRIF